MANKAQKNKPARKTLKPNEYYKPKTKRYGLRVAYLLISKPLKTVVNTGKYA